MNKLKISIPSEIDSIVKVENFIEIFMENFNLPSELLGRISLSLIETVNNSVLHGNKRDVNKMVDIVVQKIGNQFKVTVSDEGKGFDYIKVPNPTLLDSMGESVGRGLFLMKSLSDNLIFENNGASVTLVFKV